MRRHIKEFAEEAAATSQLILELFLFHILIDQPFLLLLRLYQCHMYCFWLHLQVDDFELLGN